MSTPFECVVAIARAWLDRREPELAGTMDVAAVHAEATAGRVGGVVYAALREAPAGPGRALASALRAGYIATHLRNERLLAAARAAGAALAERGIDSVRLKGSELLLGCWPEPGLRPMDDIDLLVLPERAGEAVAALAGAGFLPASGQLPLEHYLAHHFHFALVHRDGLARLELHWRPLDRQRAPLLTAAAVWPGREPLGGGEPGHRLAREDRFLHLAAHIDKHAPFQEPLRRRIGAGPALRHPASEARLLWLLDLALVAGQGLDPVRLERRAAELGVERAAAAALRSARELLGTERFPPGLERLDEGAWRRLSEAAAVRLMLRAPGLAARLGRLDGAAQFRPLRALELPVVVLPPFREFRRTLGVGPLAAALRYPLHVVRELASGARLLAALLRARLRRREEPA